MGPFDEKRQAGEPGSIGSGGETWGVIHHADHLFREFSTGVSPYATS